MIRFLLFFLVLSSPQAAAYTSWPEKLTLLRFGNELNVATHEATFDIDNLKNDEFYNVEGEALFFPSEFLPAKYYDSSEFSMLIRDKQPIKVRMNKKIDLLNYIETPKTYGTFMVRITSSKQRDLLLSIPRFYHPIDLFLASSKEVRLLHHLGKVDKDPAKSKTLMSVSIPQLLILAKGDFYLTAHVSSPLADGKSTLNFSTFLIGDFEYLRPILHQSLYFLKAISGAFLIAFIYNLFIFLFRPRDKSSLYLSLFALCSYPISLFYIFDFGLDATNVLAIGTIFNLLGLCAMQFFLLDKLGQRISSRKTKIAQWASVISTIGACTALLLQSWDLLNLFFFFSFLSGTGLTTATLYLGIRYRLSGILYFLTGVVANSILQYLLMQMIITNSYSEHGVNMMLGNFCTTLSLALLNAKEFAVTYLKSQQQSLDLEEKNREITYFNKNLERLVEDKTKEIRSLLDYIPQGVLSIGSNGLIGKDYSAYSNKILEMHDFANRSFNELILSRWNASSDIKDQAWQAILTIVGEDELNYTLNSDKLPLEIAYIINQKEKILKATWNIELKDEKVQHILVTLLDVTNEKVLEKETEKQRKELILVSELINVPASKMVQFFGTSLPLLKENEKIIGTLDKEISHHSIRKLFVNTHTVKGAARTLQLKDLARVLHDTEDYYSNILKNGAAIDRARLQTDLVQVMELFEVYSHTNRVKLNRMGDFSKVLIERDFIERLFYFLKNLIESPNLHAKQIVNSIKEQSEALTKIIFDQLPSLFDDYQERAIRIAKDLGKAAPNFEFKIDEISISPSTHTVLDNCMNHLLRNALDHGIEGEKERLAKGKPKEGLITITTHIDHEILKITISDDGRGLAIGHLRALGLKLGLINAYSRVQDIAEIIFASGISTNREVSDISGRGVGMNAVRMFLEEAGGSISIVVGNPKAGESDFYQFLFEINLPLLKAGLHNLVA